MDVWWDTEPVNPWTGSSWSYYTEYFQWQPEANSNSAQMPINSGDVLHGSLVYSASDDSYTLTQTNTANGQASSQVVKCQDGKKFIIPYVVYEKTFPCNSYPPDENVTFFDISVECDGKGALGTELPCVGVVFVAIGIHLALICPQIAPRKCNGQRM